LLQDQAKAWRIPESVIEVSDDALMNPDCPVAAQAATNRQKNGIAERIFIN
jgi:hypothetical protein